MLALKLQHSKQVKTFVFTKNQEGINGADWEWWFKGVDGNYLGFRIQSKIINIKTNKFEHLHYKNPQIGIYQCDKLIENALNSCIPRIPLYCLFLETDDSKLLSNLSCGSFQFLKTLYGCSLISAFTVQELRLNNSKHLSELQQYIKPWHYLVCCENSVKGNFIYDMQEYCKKNFKLSIESAHDITNLHKDVNFITKKPPNYVLALIEGENNNNIQPPDKEINGLLVFTE